MIDSLWKARCPVCKWSVLIFSQEAANAAKRAHEQIKGHRNVAIQPVDEGSPAAGRTGGSGLPQRA
jgi:hypothetical protein